LGMKVLEQNFIGETIVNFNLASGIYIAKIISDNKEVTKKLIVD
ncbi:MAG: T9SS type A sorting domain-containing protein, partial [Methylotenera sp.]|nr:T9SS type A sorting domain-containing protein [Flavobacterium sp.]